MLSKASDLLWPEVCDKDPVLASPAFVVPLIAVSREESTSCFLLSSLLLHNRGKQARAQNNPRTLYQDKKKKNPEKLTFHMFKECKQKSHHTDMQKTGVTQSKRSQFFI